jgi:hypothetical protein
MKAQSVSVVSSDELTFDVHHTITSGIVAFVEHPDNEKTDSKLMKKQLQLVFHSSSKPKKIKKRSLAIIHAIYNLLLFHLSIAN